VSNSFGQLFKITTFGESHGPAVGVIIDGCPPKQKLDLSIIERDLLRRSTGQSKLVSQRKEPDQIEILSGYFEGQTTGTPLTIIVKNKDQKPQAYDHLKDVYRPSHADYTYEAKYGFRDHRGGGRTSARETTSRVIAGSIASQLLTKYAGIEILAWVSQVGDIESETDTQTVTFESIESNDVRCPDPKAAAEMEQAIMQARKDGDSLGGVVNLLVNNVPAGLGAPVFDRLEADLAKAMLSLPATKGFEIGSGFAGTRLRGSLHNDAFATDENGEITTLTNNSGGVQGGISNGQPITCRIAFKPTATIAATQQTVNTAGENVELEAKGRHDPCVLPRAVPLVEAMAALVIFDHWLLQKTVDL